jgi:hypothetical protein
MLRLTPTAPPCDCPLTVLVLEHLGAKDAARMHGDPEGRWTGTDWLLHIRDEELYFFPLAARIAPAEVEVLRLDHLVFIEEIASTGMIQSLARLRIHARTEDELAQKLVDLRIVRL